MRLTAVFYNVEYTKSAHSIYHLKYHVIWVCKYRRKILNPGVSVYIRKLMPQILRQLPGVKVDQLGIDEDHLHMVMEIPPKYSISSVMGQLKSQSASHLRRRFPHLQKVYWKENIVWSTGYFVSSVGADEKTINKYVKHQGDQDLGQLRMEL